MVDVVTNITIERPVEQVAEYAGDPSNAPKWYVNIESVVWKTEPPVRLDRSSSSWLGSSGAS